MLDKTCIFEHNYRKLFFISLKKRTNFRFIFWKRCRRTQESRSETLDFNYTVSEEFISQQIIFQCFYYCGRHIHFQNSLISTFIITCHFKKVHNGTWLPFSLALFPLTLNTNLHSDRPIFTIACLYCKWIKLYIFFIMNQNGLSLALCHNLLISLNHWPLTYFYPCSLTLHGPAPWIWRKRRRARCVGTTLSSPRLGSTVRTCSLGTTPRTLTTVYRTTR